MENNKIYFSGSIEGVKHKDTNFSWELVQYMKELGFNVLSEHVAARDRKEMSKLFHKNTGLGKTAPDKKYLVAYEWDMKWVDECNYLIAVVDGPSHGVGMEIMRAILKPERGLNETKILCLVSEENIGKLSGMIQGVPRDEYPNYDVMTYSGLENAKEIVNKFLKKS